MSSVRLTVVMPVYNEAAALGTVLTDITINVLDSYRQRAGRGRRQLERCITLDPRRCTVPRSAHPRAHQPCEPWPRTVRASRDRRVDR